MVEPEDALMKNFGISVPSNVTQMAAIAGMVIVALSTFGVHGLWPSWTLPVIGAFLGLFAIGDSKNFLISGLALLGAKWGLARLPMFGDLMQDFATNLIVLVAPAMLVVAMRSIYREIKS